MDGINNALNSTPGNHRLRRGIALWPVLFTTSNLAFGFYAILSTMRGGIADFDSAARFIGLAILFDALDGRIARATGTTSEFGKQFDSLADMVSFGIAPAFLAFVWGGQLLLADGVGLQRYVYWFGMLATFGFVICCAWRLARFNIQGMAPGAESRYFLGMPTPAAAGMIAATVHFWQAPLEDWRASFIWLALVAGLAALMASTVRYYGFKDINLRRRHPAVIVVPAGLLVFLIVTQSRIVLLIIAATYMFSGFTLHAFRNLRQRRVARAS